MFWRLLIDWFYLFILQVGVFINVTFVYVCSFLAMKLFIKVLERKKGKERSLVGRWRFREGWLEQTNQRAASEDIQANQHSEGGTYRNADGKRKNKQTRSSKSARIASCSVDLNTQLKERKTY